MRCRPAEADTVPEGAETVHRDRQSRPTTIVLADTGEIIRTLTIELDPNQRARHPDRLRGDRKPGLGETTLERAELLTVAIRIDEHIVDQLIQLDVRPRPRHIQHRKHAVLDQEVQWRSDAARGVRY